jgi:hypothetical protein
MTSSHPTEKEIQEYVLDRSACPPDLIDHIASCAFCQEEAGAYLLLFAELKQEPVSTFDFDLSGLVLPLLPSPDPLISADRFIAGFLVVFISCCIGIPVFLFNRNIINMFSGIPPLFIYTILGSASLILLLRTLDIYKNYRAQMRQLNYP